MLKNFLSIFSLLLLINWFVPSAHLYAAANAVTPEFPFYLEIEEDNIDSFPVNGHTEGTETLEAPFWVENGRVFFHQDLPDAISRGEQKQNFNLFIAPAKFDEKNIKLLVKHDIHFEGKGRNTETTRYYMFDAWPAVIPFEPVNIDRTEVNIDLEENEVKLLNIRLTEESLTVDFDEMTGKLRAKYGAVVSDLPKDRAWEISEKSQKISVSRQMTARHQIKDPAAAGVPESTRHQFGEVEFKTKLTLKNLGACPIA